MRGTARCLFDVAGWLFIGRSQDMFRLSRFDCRGWFSQSFDGSNRSGEKRSSKARPRSTKSVLQFEQLEVRQLLTGDFVWVNAVGSTGAESANAVATDSAGNVYTAGTFSGTVDFDPGAGTANLTGAGGTLFVTKVGSNGALLWARNFGPGSGAAGGGSVNGIAVDSTGNVYTTGRFYASADFDPGSGTANLTGIDHEVFVSKLDSSGNFVWAKSKGGGGPSVQSDSGNAIAVDGSGNVYSTGFLGFFGDWNAFVWKLDSAGNTAWTKLTESSSSTTDVALGIAVDASGSVYTTGYFNGTVDFDPGSGTANLISAGGSDAFVWKLTSAGNFAWAKRMGGTSADSARGIGVDGSGNIYTTGIFEGTTDFDPSAGISNLISAGITDAFVSKLDSNGNHVWARSVGGSGNDKGNGIAVDSTGNVYSTGYFEGTADFDPGTGVSNLISAGTTDVFVSRLDSNGNHVWSRSVGGSGDDGGNGIAVDSTGIVYTAGKFSETVDFDPGFGTATRTSAGFSDAFTLKLSPDMLFDLSGLTGDVKLVRNGDLLDLFFNGSFTFGTYVLLDQEPLSDIRSVRIGDTAGLANSVTLDFLAGGTFSIDGGIHFAAGAGTADSIRFLGRANEGFTYAPSSTVTKAGTMRTYGDDVTFTGVENVFVTNTQALLIEPQGSADVLTVVAATGFGGALGSRISGTSGGAAIVPLTFDNIRDVTIDMGARDGVLAQSNDSITFSTGSLEAAGMMNLTVLGGKGADNLTVNNVDLGLPVSGGAFRFEGGAGSDRLAVNGDIEYRLNDTRLMSTGGGRILHDEVERAALNGGAGNNTLIGVGYSGALTLNGLGGNDLMWGGTSTNTILGGTGDDRLYGNAFNDILDGGDGNDLLYGYDGNDSLIGGIGNDQLFGDLGDDSLIGDAGNDQLFGGLGNDSINGGAGLDLLWFDGSDNADSLRLQFLSATTANFIRKPRGLQSVLEQDSVVYDATDEAVVNALDGDDLITIDAAFAILGLVDGGNGIDTCTAPVGWTKASC